MLRTFFKLIRVNNWIKNGFVFLPLVFSTQLRDPQSWYNITLAAIAFSFTSSFVYIINDILDKKSDALHPTKKFRPIAAGDTTIIQAVSVAIVLLGIAFVTMWNLSPSLSALLIGYLALNLAYSFYLKQISIVDCICVAIGFVIRILVGCLAIDVVASDWILAVTFFLALYLAFSKRKAELLLLTDQSTAHRKSLNGYTLKLLDTYILICAVISLTAYLLYSFDFAVVSAFHTSNLKYSVVFVVIGFFRYFQLVETSGNEGDPTTLVLKDRALQLSIVLWLVYVVWVIYG
jgi:decaprenyl-phosphate phosphoribosyltransferase